MHIIDISRNVIYLMLALIITVLIWSATMSIESAVKSQGTVVTSEHRKVVTHYEGGVIEEILIREGDKVTKGQSLMTINNLSIDEKNQQNQQQVDTLSTKLQRLQAELNEESSFAPDINNEFTRREKQAFNVRLRELNTKVAIIQDRIAQKRVDLNDFSSKKLNLKKQKDIFQQQYQMLADLVEQEAASLNMLLEKENELVSSNRQYSEVTYAIERYKLEIDEMDKEIDHLKGLYKLQAKEEYDEVFEELSDQKNQLKVVQKRQNRSLLTSPHDGVIYKINANTVGETVKSGQVLIEIVPDTLKLVVKAKLLAEDRDKVWNGMLARVSPVYRDFSSTPIEAEVIQVSADSSYDEYERRRYFEVLLESENFVKDKHKFIVSGMMVDVSVITGQHKLLEYLLRPVLRGWDNMFSEPI